MSIFNVLSNGFGTLLGVFSDTKDKVISSIKRSYEAYRERKNASNDSFDDVGLKKDRLRSVNDEIMHLRNLRMSSGYLSEKNKKRWEYLSSERAQIMADLNDNKELKTAEKIFENQADIEALNIDLETTHILQYNAFADTLGKKCDRCSRPMKLQWRRDLSVAKPEDFYWGCTGWYIESNGRRACKNIQPLKKSDYGLMVDTTAPEFSMTAEDFSFILTHDATKSVVVERLDDLNSELKSKRKGVELATCPVHGVNMVLRKKKNAKGLLDSYFLSCPYWKPQSAGCNFMEKLKSGSQLAALLKSETGQGIL